MSLNAEELEDVKRMNEKLEWLAKTWLIMRKRFALPEKEAFELNPDITKKTVFHYVKDLRFLKKRYQIEDMVQPPKIAGLMANAILKYRPLVPFYGPQGGIEKNKVNEYFAIYHGICVCANYKGLGVEGNSAMRALMANPKFKEWHEKFTFLIRERNYTAESLIMAFETLCLFAFPAAKS
ncbi:MAG: hypothetical protein LBI42_11325 [Chitinispirillales bacterium]|jgi:hypothetical protein|nr:hypothetical protein [Chitinispirillales bacterium]